MKNIVYSLIDSIIGPIGLVASEKGLLRIELRCPPEEDFVADIEKAYKSAVEHAPNSPFLRAAAKQIKEYLGGKRTKFDLPLDLRGPDFMLKVIAAMMKIPYGATKTYGEMAQAAGRPKAARAVGRAVGANPLPIVAPCHRVIGSNGKLVGFGSGIDLKSHLLNLEQHPNR